MAKYRKRPVTIDAVQWTGDILDVIELCGKELPHFYGGFPGSLAIPTLEGTMECRLGDYLIKGVAGEIYPCKPDIFERTYEKVEPGYDGNGSMSF